MRRRWRGGGSTPTVSLTVQPTSIALGQSATLTWSADAGTTCTASDAWTGTQGATGTLVVTPAAAGTLTYTLSCTGGTFTRTGQASATLTVNAPTAYSATSLVSDTAGTGALVVDPNLVNPWGVVFGPTTSAWVANNHTDTSTLYDGNGKAQPAASPLIVHLPARLRSRPVSSLTAAPASRSPRRAKRDRRASSSMVKAAWSVGGRRRWTPVM